MHNTCVSSSFSVRYRGPSSFSFNDYSCCFSDRFDRHPLLNSATLLPQCCACCCSNLFNGRAPILKPSCIFGLRQSTLIQWSPYKRLILNGLDRCYASRFSVSDIDRNCFCENCDLKERKVCGRRGKLGRGRYRCMVFEEGSERHSLCGGSGSLADEAEVVLSLLTEDVSDECFGVRERRKKLFRKIDVEKGEGNGRADNVRSQKKNGESSGLESISKFKYQEKILSSRDDGMRNKEATRREDDKESVVRNKQRGRAKKEQRGNWFGENSNEIARQEERQILLRENRRERLREEEQKSLSRREDYRQKVRKDGSSCSSFYSFSSGEFEHDDDDIEVQQEGFKDELSGGYTKDSKMRQEVVSKEAEEEFEKHDHSTEYRVILSKDSEQTGYSGASSVVESDWRKKSEKKLTDTSVGKTQYSKDASMYSNDKEKTGKMSTFSVNFDDRTSMQTSETGTRIKYKQFTEKSDTYAADIETSSTSHKLHGGIEGNSSKSTKSFQETKEQDHMTAEQISRAEEYRGSSFRFADASKAQKLDSRGTNIAERRSEIRMNDLEDHSTRIQSSVHDTEEQHHQTVQASRILDSRAKHQQLTTDVNKESTSVSQRESENRMRKQELESSHVYNSHLETREHLREMDSKRASMVETRNESQEASGLSLTSTSNINVSFVGDRDRRKFEVLMAPSPSQLPATGSPHSESTSGLGIEEIVDDRLQSRSATTSGLRTEEVVDEKLFNRSTALRECRLDKSQTLPQTEGDQSHGQTVKLLYPEDALGSADRLQKFSAHYVGEFVQKMTSEILSSEIHGAKDTHKSKLLSKEKQDSQASLGSYGSEAPELKEQHSRRSSQGSGIKGPSDEIWDVTEPTIGKSPEAEKVVAESTTENAVVKRSGKSLWNIIADVVRFRWVSRSENRSSPSKSGGKSSPNQSTSSGTWFSGHEQEENNVLNVQEDKISLTQGSLPVEQQQEEKASQVHVPCPSSSKGETKDSRVGASSQKDSSLKATSLPSSDASSETNCRATSAVTEEAHLLPQLPSLQVERILATGETEGTTSGTIIQVDQPVPTVLSDKSSPESRNEELKRGKFQRIDQVQKDRFDEWEEAYRFETEQRKMDEMFMREALLEAKKAADSWEVPVGAVLVRDGKIIARGYNLVEELRDSTAHAEMICIREASNVLRTWRLSETTLYVTLEPCPMCAGAILQARVDTVVWGAPNKLLGADGSWIRLFPDGNGGLESSDKPSPPMHPFHPKMVIRRGILSSECADMMKQFFQLRRRKKDKKNQEPTTPPSCLPISHHPSKFLTKMHDAFHLMFCL